MPLIYLEYECDKKSLNRVEYYEHRIEHRKRLLRMLIWSAGDGAWRRGNRLGDDDYHRLIHEDGCFHKKIQQLLTIALSTIPLTLNTNRCSLQFFFTIHLQSLYRVEQCLIDQTTRDTAFIETYSLCGNSKLQRSSFRSRTTANSSCKYFSKIPILLNQSP